MCPRDKHTRKQGYMDFTLYQKLIKEIAQHKDTVRRVHLHNFGEPLLDKDLPRKVRLAKEWGIRHTYVVTNASLLTPETSRALIEAGLDEFKISFCGANKETYNMTMVGLDFDTTLRNITEFFKIRKEMKSQTPRVIIQCLSQESNKSAKKEFRNIFRQIIDTKIGDSIIFAFLHNYGGGRDYRSLEGNICSICNFPWRMMMILYDGKVVPCCLDYNGVQVLGDVRESTIEEIWNGLAFIKMRDDFKRLQYKDYPLCLQCEGTR